MAPEKPQNYWQNDDANSPVAPVAPGQQPATPAQPVPPPPTPLVQVQPEPQPSAQQVAELPMAEPDVPAAVELQARQDFDAADALDGGDEFEPTSDNDQDAQQSESLITWSAQEYVHAEKGPLWFIVFIAVVLILVAVDVFFLKSWTFSALVVVMAVTLAIYIRRPARTLTYGLSLQQGLYVGEKLYIFDEFKSFGIIQDQGNFSIMLIPRKRFAPGVSVFFPEDSGEKIVDILGQRLPMEDLKLDFVDVIVRKLRL